MLKAIHVLLIITFSISEGPTRLEASATVTKKPLKRLPKPRGLYNVGLTCFMNAGLQMLYATAFVDIVAALADCSSRNTVAIRLHNFFQAYSTLPKGVLVEQIAAYPPLDTEIIDALYIFFTKTGVDGQPATINTIVKPGVCEDDTLYFFDQLIRAIANECEKCNISHPSNIIVGITVTEPHGTKSTSESATYITLAPGDKNVAEGIANYIATYEYTMKDGRIGYRKKTFIELPKLLIIAGATKENMDAYRLKFSTDLSLYVSTNPKEPINYILKGIGLYRATGRHYSAGYSLFESSWYFCDDSTVSPISKETIEEFANNGFIKHSGSDYTPRVFIYERIDRKKDSRETSLIPELTTLSGQLDTLAQAVLQQKK